jgi:uncharacterized protein (TIGR03437 family)
MKAYFRNLGSLSLILLSTWTSLALAQTGSFRQVRVSISTPGVTFFVDNTPYNSTQIFRWQVGDLHTIRFPRQVVTNTQPGVNGGPIGTRNIYSGQYTVTTDGGQAVPPGTFLDLTTGTDPDYIYKVQVFSFLQSIDFSTSIQHQIRINTPGVGCAPTALGETLPGSCSDIPGYTAIRCFDGSTFTALSGDFWCPAGETEFTSVPSVGYAFKDWNSNPSLPNPTTTGVAGSLRFVLSGPMHMQVNFGPGKFYRINTEPAGFEVVVDRSIIKTGNVPLENRDICTRYAPAQAPDGSIVNFGVGGEAGGSNFCTVWLVGSTRILGAPELQRDSFGKTFVFDKWSFGGGQNALFEVSGANLSTNLLTARFVPAAPVTFLTQPRLNLPLIINNRTWPGSFFHFGLNRDIPFSAPLETVDSDGRRWRFKGWSNGGPASQTLRITQELVDNGIVLIALYEPLNKLSIETNPSGLPVTVDGRTCPTPCMVERAENESVTVASSPTVTQANVLRLEFTNWSDGGAETRQIGFQPVIRRIVANYKQLYRLTALGNPRQGVTFSFNPAAPDDFYDLGRQVTVTARANNGFRFRRWGGDTAGMFPSASVTMGGPRTVVAELETIPFIDPAGVKNAAGTGPQDDGPMGRVAPGSLITIFGVNLTPREEIGPRAPQVQTLAELAVRAGDRLLPLSFANSNQVNAQLPFDLPLGPNKLTVIRTGQPDVSADFEVVRNAPGLFTQYGTEQEGQPPMGLAFRADGSVVTEQAPARPNEVINLVGTGLGGFRNNPPPGFEIPAGAEFTLIDPVEVLVGDQTIQPLRVIATPGFVGMTTVQIRVGPQFPVGQSSNLRIRVSGKESNTVRLLVR